MALKKCPKCGTEFDDYSKWGPRRFCSRKCSNSRVQTPEANKKRSNTLKGNKHNQQSSNKGKQLVEREKRICPECGSMFEVLPSSRTKFCCKECRAKNVGGYREGSGRAKTGYYKGVYCGSTYELVWVIYQLDHNKPFERFVQCLQYDGVKYFPDFLQEGKIVEIKGYEKQESVDKKTLVANRNGYNVKVLRKGDLKEEFDYVKTHYNYRSLVELYDGYKPTYTYNCSYCLKDFTRDTKLKTEVVFCSRSCAGKGHRGRVYTP